MNISLKKLTSKSQIKGDTPKETNELKEMLKEASDFLASFKWCGGVEESYFGIGIPSVVAVFLFKIRPSKEGVDDWLWVVVGDVPSAYLVIDDAPNPASALEAYIYEMKRWVKAVKDGKSVDDLIPVNVAPTTNNAEQLDSRLDFLRHKFLCYFSDDLKHK